MEGPLIAAAGLFMVGLVILYALLVRIAGPRRRLETALGIDPPRRRHGRGAGGTGGVDRADGAGRAQGAGHANAARQSEQDRPLLED